MFFYLRYSLVKRTQSDRQRAGASAVCSRNRRVLVPLNRCKDENRSARSSYYQAILQGAAYLEDSQDVRDGGKELQFDEHNTCVIDDSSLAVKQQRPHRILGTPPCYKTLYLPTA